MEHEEELQQLEEERRVIQSHLSTMPAPKVSHRPLCRCKVISRHTMLRNRNSVVGGWTRAITLHLHKGL